MAAPWTGKQVAHLVGGLVSVAGLAGCITLLFLAMRAVMAVGGTCASGGPYEVAVQCPNAVAWVVPVAIFGGLFFIALLRAVGLPQAWPLAYLAWPALFLSLGWNFFDFGLPWHSQSTAVGFLIPGVLFLVMGGGPLLAVLPGISRRWAGTHRAAPQVPASSTVAGLDLPPPQQKPTRTDGVGHGGSLADDLERLAALHRTGELSDEEYAAAKGRRIGDGGAQ